MESPQLQQDRYLWPRLRSSLVGLPTLGLALLFAAVYLAFPTRQYYWDGISFSIDIEQAQSWRDLFNVHHLLYNHIGYLEYKFLRGFSEAASVGVRVL